MAAVKMKKLSTVASRDDTESILSELVQLGCVEICEPSELFVNQDIASCFSRETIALAELNADRESVELLGTKHTLLLSGWMTIRCQTDLISKLNNYACAWEIEDLTADEALVAPVNLCCPNFFGKLRRGGREQFSPLAKGRAL